MAKGPAVGSVGSGVAGWGWGTGKGLGSKRVEVVTTTAQLLGVV